MPQLLSDFLLSFQAHDARIQIGYVLFVCCDPLPQLRSGFTEIRLESLVRRGDGWRVGVSLAARVRARPDHQQNEEETQHVVGEETRDARSAVRELRHGGGEIVGLRPHARVYVTRDTTAAMKKKAKFIGREGIVSQ